MTTTTFHYRNHDATVAHRLLLRRERILEELALPDARARARILRRRVARSFGGAAALLSMAALLLPTLALTADDHTTALAFFASLAAAPVGYLLGMMVAPVIERRALRRECVADSDPVVALDRLQHASGSAVASRAAGRWTVASLSLPLAAVALLGPLTLHAPFFIESVRPLHEFGQWVMLSVVIVGHAHLALAFFAHRFVTQLAAGTPMMSEPALKTWLKTVLVAAVPGILLFGLPPILTAVTGPFLIWPMFYWARWRMDREQAQLD